MVKLADVAHRTEHGAVLTGIAAADVAGAVETLRKIAARDGLPDTVVLQPQLAGHGEAFIGLTGDTELGPMVAFGLGGVFVEVMKRVGGRLAPFSAADAEELVAEFDDLGVIDGVRGMAPWDRAALVDDALQRRPAGGRRPQLDPLHGPQPADRHRAGSRRGRLRLLRRPGRRLTLATGCPTARLILLHGAVERAGLFDAVVPFLDGFDVVALERAGHGVPLDRKGPARWRATCAMSSRCCRRDRPPSSATASGGWPAIGAALAVPELVRGVGLYETAIPWADWWTDDGRDAMLHETEANVAAAEGIDPSNPARDRLRMAWATCLQEVRDAFDAPFAWQELTVPVTTGFGREGTRPSARDAALVAAHYGVEPVVLAGAGHRAPKTDPEAFAGFVRRCDQHARLAAPGAWIIVDI